MDYTGLTGEVKFDMNGLRTDFKMDLMEKQRDNMVKTGVWLLETGVNYTRTVGDMDAIVVAQLENSTLKVTTAMVSI